MGLDWCLDNPCDAIDAPRVDTEERAREIWDEFARDQYKFDTFEEFWEWAEGSADCQKCRVWEEYLDEDAFRGGSFLTTSCEWRGKRLRFVGDHRIEWLVDQSYEDMEPSDMEWFAAEIRKEILENPGMQDVYGIDEDDLVTLKEAVNWLEYWAEQGVSMNAWY